MIRNLLPISLVGLFLIASLVAGIIHLTSNNPIDVETMAVANQLYSNGEYSTAAKIYEQLLSQGQQHSSLYYNLGNAYYAQGDFGRAILNFQRASRLDPRDPDIRANLALARTQSATDYAQPSNPFEAMASFSSSWLTLNETALITLVLWFLLGFLVFTYRQLPPGRMRTIALNGFFATLLIILVAGVSFGSRIYLERTKPEAVIIAEQVTINSSPADDSSTEFNLTSGTEVKLLEIRADWAKLGLPNDVFEGWIPLNTIETVSLNHTFGLPTF